MEMKTRILAWTPTAIDCLQLHCQCSKCFIYYLYFKNKQYKCKMKETVTELIEKIGLPKEDEKKILKAKNYH